MTEIVNSFDLRKLEQFLLILTRITSFVYVAPIFSLSGLPQRVKISMCIFISLLLYGTMDYQIPEYTSLIDYASLVLMESVAGLLIGFGAFICISIIGFTGKILDMEVGLSMATIFDPATNSQSSAVGAFYQYMIMIFMIISDMHLYLLKALADSYEIIALGNVGINGGLYNIALESLAQFVLIGFKIAMPVFAAMLVVNIVMGILAKAAPQMSMFAVGIQIKIIIGFFVIYITSVLIPDIANIIFDEMQRVLVQILKGMR